MYTLAKVLCGTYGGKIGVSGAAGFCGFCVFLVGGDGLFWEMKK